MSKSPFHIGRHLLPGVIAVALFGVMAAVFLTASIPEPAGFGDASVIESIGFSLLDITDADGTVPTEGFLAAFILIAFALDAALDGSIMLAQRDDEDVPDLRPEGSDRRKGGDE